MMTPLCQMSVGRPNEATPLFVAVVPIPHNDCLDGTFKTGWIIEIDGRPLSIMFEFSRRAVLAQELEETP